MYDRCMTDVNDIGLTETLSESLGHPTMGMGVRLVTCPNLYKIHIVNTWYTCSERNVSWVKIIWPVRIVIRKIAHTIDYMYLPMPPISGQRPATEVWLIFIDTRLGKQRIWYWYCLFPVSCPFSSSEIREKDLMKLCLLQVHAKKNTVK